MPRFSRHRRRRRRGCVPEGRRRSPRAGGTTTPGIDDLRVRTADRDPDPGALLPRRWPSTTRSSRSRPRTTHGPRTFRPPPGCSSRRSPRRRDSRSTAAISLDPVVLADIPSGTGGVNVEGVDITAENAVKLLLNQTNFRFPGDQVPADAFFAATSATVFQKLVSGDGGTSCRCSTSSQPPVPNSVSQPLPVHF